MVDPSIAGPVEVDLAEAVRERVEATGVGLGRPYYYGLALDGAEGAAHVLRSVLAEMDLMMAVNGYPTVEAVRAAGALRDGGHMLRA